MPGSPLARGSAWAGGRDHTPSRVPLRWGTSTSCREAAPLTYLLVRASCSATAVCREAAPLTYLLVRASCSATAVCREAAPLTYLLVRASCSATAVCREAAPLTYLLVRASCSATAVCRPACSLAAAACASAASRSLRTLARPCGESGNWRIRATGIHAQPRREKQIAGID
jgi:hypothetical protein